MILKGVVAKSLMEYDETYDEMLQQPDSSSSLISVSSDAAANQDIDLASSQSRPLTSKN